MTTNRREFLKKTRATSLGMAAGVTILANAKSVRGAPAADKVNLGFIGVGGRGPNLARGFLERGDCVISYIADANSAILEGRASDFAKQQGGLTPKTTDDMRKLLDDKSIDAVVIATPDHWHALATIWACQAGKDVYVEKPPTHDCWEGQQMLKAARKYNRIVQCGFQNRSAPYNFAAKKFIEDGGIGTIHLCRIFNQKPPWGNPKPVPDSDAPAGLNWDMFNGPAPEHPYNKNYKQSWHHLWRYSGGDMANDASHQIDLARWLAGAELPKSVYCTGGRFCDTGGIAETPDTQTALFDYDDKLISFELTLFGNYMLKTDPIVRNSDMFPYWRQNATRIEIYGSKGMMIVGRHGGGWQAFGRPKSRQPVVIDECYGRFPDPEHKENFLHCLKTREEPNADIAKAHRSVLLIHYGNISYRTGGQKLFIDHETEQIKDNPEAMALFRRTYRAPYVVPEEV